MIKKIYKDDSPALSSFNELTRKTFWVDFVSWHGAGHFSDMYVPHVIMDGEKVVSNVSVNQMQILSAADNITHIEDKQSV